MFESWDEIEPLLERPYDGESATLSLAAELAAKLECYVLAGFPECASEHSRRELAAEAERFDARASEIDKASSCLPKVRGRAYNAAMLVGRDGALVKVFRKHFLYEADACWSDEGGGFEYVDLPGLGRLCVAICMDLNRTWRISRSVHARGRL